MNIKQLQILDAVVRLGSYRKAAAQLRCSQSTITFQLKKLEDSLGCFLFEKTGRHMVLTPAGQAAPQRSTEDIGQSFGANESQRLKSFSYRKT